MKSNFVVKTLCAEFNWYIHLTCWLCFRLFSLDKWLIDFGFRIFLIVKLNHHLPFFFSLSRENGADSILDLGLLDSSDKVQVTYWCVNRKLGEIQLSINFRIWLEPSLITQHKVLFNYLVELSRTYLYSDQKIFFLLLVYAFERLSSNHSKI